MEPLIFLKHLSTNLVLPADLPVNLSAEYFNIWSECKSADKFADKYTGN